MRTRILLAGIALFALAAIPAQGQGVIGLMTCSVAGGFGIVVGSSRGVTCAYHRPDGATDFYSGTLSHIGVDVGPTNPLTVTYRVVGADLAVRGSLAGVFAGAAAGATIGSGVGADAWVGGNGKAVSLVPTENEQLTGLNVNAGISELNLRYVGSQQRPRYVDPIYQ